MPFVHDQRVKRWPAIPQEICDQARELAETHELQEVARLLDLVPSQITAMKQRGWKAAKAGRKQRPMPETFASDCGYLTFQQLCEKHQAAPGTVARWRSELPEHPLPLWRTEEFKVVPKDLWQDYNRLTLRELKAKYRCGHRQLYRWFKRMGVNRRPQWRPHNKGVRKNG